MIAIQSHTWWQTVQIQITANWSGSTLFAKAGYIWVQQTRVNTYHVMGKIQQMTNWWYFPYISQKIGFDILCTFCMKSQSLFCKKIKKKYFQMSSADISTEHAKCSKMPEGNLFWVPYIQYCKMNKITHFSRETPKRVTGKQCRPISDTAECGFWSGSPMFANSCANFL